MARLHFKLMIAPRKRDQPHLALHAHKYINITNQIIMSTQTNESFIDKVKRKLGNCWATTLSCGKNAKESTIIAKLNFDIETRKKNFGVAYMNKIKSGASEEDLAVVVDKAKKDIAELERQVKEKEDAIEGNKEKLRQKIEESKSPGGSPISSAVSTQPSTLSPPATPVEATPVVATTTITPEKLGGTDETKEEDATESK